MPIIKHDDANEEKLSWRIRLRTSICSEIEEYCAWAGIRYRDFFVERAARHVFESDQDWIAHKARQKRIRKKSES